MSPHKTCDGNVPESLEAYDVFQNGFLPRDDPLDRLSHPYYQPWEDIMKDLPRAVSTGDIRASVDNLPVLKTCFLDSKPEWQRAYMMLTFLAQGYIWSSEIPAQSIPPNITIPLLEVSWHLEVMPVASYAGLNLWNWRRLSKDADLTDPSNIAALHTITGTEDESWFYVISTALEATAAALLGVMIGTNSATLQDDHDGVVLGLEEIKENLALLTTLIGRMEEHCDPQVFYHRIRPLLAGSLNMEAAGLPKGIFYDEGNGKGEWKKYRGASNGQSSLIQFFDVVLGIQHDDSEKFHEEMRKYMPEPHARLLEHMESSSRVRSYVSARKDNIELVKAYDDALESLKLLREKHIQLVARYIILPSRMPTPTADVSKKNLATASKTCESNSWMAEGLVGTGGTTLIPFLKQARDATAATTLTRNNSSVVNLPELEDCSTLDAFQTA